MMRLTACALVAACSLVTPAGAAALSAHGQLLHLVHGPGGRFSAGQSNNWFGYNQGTLERGALFHSIAGSWTVPTASQHTRGQAEYSSDWIGIGGGCVDKGCLVTDPTLIQTGTEQDVSGSGARSYSAWWEIIPGPSVTIGMKVRPGDRMQASITEIIPGSNLWTITLRDLTRRESHSVRVPYSSTQDTAEWIEETPLILGQNAGFAALPGLSSPTFELAAVNGRPAALGASEALDLVNSQSRVIAVPSAQDRDRDGFNACTWTGICAPPTRS
jgi:hypothetical protein